MTIDNIVSSDPEPALARASGAADRKRTVEALPPARPLRSPSSRASPPARLERVFDQEAAARDVVSMFDGDENRERIARIYRKR